MDEAGDGCKKNFTFWPEDFNEDDFGSQEKLLKRLENLQESIKKIQEQELSAW